MKSVIPCVKLATEEEGSLTRGLVFLQCRNKEKGTVQPGQMFVTGNISVPLCHDLTLSKLVTTLKF